MTVKKLLNQARAALAAGGVEDSALEAELLLRHALKIDRVQLYLDLDREVSQAHHKNFRRLIERRLKGEPSAYITGHREFSGLGFYVSPAVLIPRPESELLVEKAIELAQNGASIAEIGTGCGAIAISLALKLPAARIYATDISPAALEVARRNCRHHRVTDRICLLQGDLLDPLPGPVDLLIANLPYVKAAELARTDLASFEPRLALDGGRDGLAKIRGLCRQLSGPLHPRGHLLLEIGQGQAKSVVSYLRNLFPSARIETTTDLGGIERVVGVYLTPGNITAKLDCILSDSRSKT